MHSRMRLILWILFKMSFMISTAGAFEVRLQPAPASATLFETYRDGQPIAPPTGSLALIGRLDVPGFSIDNINQLETVLPSGKTVSLMVDEKRVFREFGKIVSLDFCLTVPEGEFSEKESVLILHWGPQVTAQNERVSGFSIDQANAGRYRVLFPSAPSGEERDESATTDIQATADKTANYIPLWHLLPMGLVFVILTIRKLANA